ncbi:MAG: hypothetical protein A4E56_01390 [Pelotomaculum sp. PtaU1.Bin065]|nr:MAG: hypothetical protein A4E56_01390 [Pelotomaculum sp. PtaU1.Bin065]
MYVFGATLSVIIPATCGVDVKATTRIGTKSLNIVALLVKRLSCKTASQMILLTMIISIA